MDSRGMDRMDEQPVADTPEDVAVLYSWANLHGAKYRDFSASRREYRAQLRHRAAEQIREQELKAQADAEAAASVADAAARQAEAAAMEITSSEADSSREQAQREANRESRIAAAERVEAARRAEAAAVAEAAARRAEREIAEAHESSRRQAERYADAEVRVRESGIYPAMQLPGEISDPYAPNQAQYQAPASHERRPAPRVETRYANEFSGRSAQEYAEPALVNFASASADLAPSIENQANEFQAIVERIPVSGGNPASRQNLSRDTAQITSPSTQRRRQGYRPDDASGVRQIYRGSDFEGEQGEPIDPETLRQLLPSRGSSSTGPIHRAELESVTQLNPEPVAQGHGMWPFTSDDRFDSDFSARPVQPIATRREPSVPALKDKDRSEPRPGQTQPSQTQPSHPQAGQARPEYRGFDANRPAPLTSPRGAPSPGSVGAGSGRRAQDDLGYKPPVAYAETKRRIPVEAPRAATSSTQRQPYVADPSGPAWLYAPQTAPSTATIPVVPIQTRPTNILSSAYASAITAPGQSSVADTLQHSRERVAARWFALKGVFEQPGQEQEAPIRQKEVRTPALAVFSFAGGVGKTSLVATLGRALSSMGEKVLLTDTTSHGLLPFYFGASELRQGVVRTFSPPSGSTDAPIYLVSYDIEQKSVDEAAQEQLVAEIATNSKGMHRILLDLTPGSGWVVRRMARMNPTVLVPLAPDMNSVISLQAVEKFFQGTIDADGRPLQPYYVVNQFDPSLPLHLDVREVLRRQLGERLLPFVIRRTPSVSEALAEGMTVVDYAPETPIAEDYQNVAAWLRTIAAPATAGFRNVRWSER